MMLLKGLLQWGLVLAELSLFTAINSLDVFALNFPPPPNRGNPTTTLPGGTRGSYCTQKNKERISIVGLMPKDKVISTLSPHPTMYFYIPKNNAKALELFVADAEGKPIYYQQFELNKQIGWLKLSLPTTLTLSENQFLKWEFSLICSLGDRSNDDFISGFLYRPKLNNDERVKLQKIGKNNDVLANAKIYADLFLWNEALEELDKLRENQSTIWKKEWNELLQSIGITDKNILEAKFIQPLPEKKRWQRINIDKK
jgi:hypothetical protein